MSHDYYDVKGHIEVNGVSADVAGLIDGMEVTLMPDHTRLSLDEQSLPDYETVAEQLENRPWVTVVTDGQDVTISAGGEVIAEGGISDNLSVMDIAKIVEASPDSVVHLAMEERCWGGSEVGGSASYYGQQFSGYTDSVEVMDDYRAIDASLGKEDAETAAGIIVNRVEQLLTGVRDGDMRQAVAAELHRALPDMCTNYMSPEDIERAANEF